MFQSLIACFRKLNGDAPELSDDDLWKAVTASAWSRRVGFLLTDQATQSSFSLPAVGSTVSTFAVHYYQVTEPQFWEGGYEYAVAEAMRLLNSVRLGFAQDLFLVVLIPAAFELFLVQTTAGQVVFSFYSYNKCLNPYRMNCKISEF